MSDPRIWGWDAWKFFHRAGFAYPENPTESEKEKMRRVLANFDIMLPCPMCSLHYIDYFNRTFNDSVLESSETLSRWIYDLHESVNKRFGIDSKVKFEDVRGLVNKFPTRYVDLDTGEILETPRYTDAGGVSSPQEARARKWLEKHPGKSLNDRSLFQQLFYPIGEKQLEFSRMLQFASLALLTVLSLIASVYFYATRNHVKIVKTIQKEEPKSVSSVETINKYV